MASARTMHLFIDPRRSARSRVLLKADIHAGAGDPIDATVTDLSRHGFRASIPEPLAAETSLRIVLPIGRIARATVAWINDGEIGCVFLRPLGEEEVKLIAEIWDRPVPKIVSVN